MDIVSTAMNIFGGYYESKAVYPHEGHGEIGDVTGSKWNS